MELALYFFVLLGLPAILVGLSRIEPGRKRKWVLIQLVFSWLGFVAFIIMLTVRYFRNSAQTSTG